MPVVIINAFLFLTQLSLSLAVRGISMAVDYNKQLVPPKSSLFSYHILNNASSFDAEFDLVSHTNWTALKVIYYNASKMLPFYLNRNDAAIKLFEDKAAWKHWMDTIGLGAYVPTTYKPATAFCTNYLQAFCTNYLLREYLLFRMPQSWKVWCRMSPRRG